VSFKSPEALWLLLLIPAAVFLFADAARRRTEALRLFFGGRGAPEQAYAFHVARVRRRRGLLVVLGVAFFILALAGPLYGTSLRESRRESLDLIIALDVSSSMLAEDIAPNRLERARLAISQLVEQRAGDRIGLVVFAGDAFLQCPLTTDRSAFRLFLDAAGPDLVATPGTDFANALFAARGALADDGEAGPPRPRAVLVVSDGEDHEGRVGEAIDALRDEGVLLLAAGVGTEEGAPIPIYRNGQRVGFKTDRNGAQIMSRLEEGVLREIAGRDGLVRLGGGTGLAEISSRLDRLDRAVLDTERYEASAERFQWPLALGLLLLLAERLMVLRAIKSPENP